MKWMMEISQEVLLKGKMHSQQCHTLVKYMWQVIGSYSVFVIGIDRIVLTY